jgi:hypothetical protein
VFKWIDRDIDKEELVEVIEAAQKYSYQNDDKLRRSMFENATFKPART